MVELTPPIPPVLVLRGICKSFQVGLPNEVQVLHDVDLTLQAGEFCAIMGPSGSGKSTLLHLVGLLDRPTRGELSIAGEQTMGLNDRALTRLRGDTIGFVFQYHHLLGAFTALENVLMPMYAAKALPTGQIWRANVAGDLPGEGETVDAYALGQIVKANRGRKGFTYTHKKSPEALAWAKHATAWGFTVNISADDAGEADQYAAHGLPTPEMHARAHELLDRVELSANEHRQAVHLSGGQQQRVALARALVMGPRLLLADEPTGNLDSHSADAVFELLRRINREQAMAVLFVTHNAALAARCDRVIRVVDGRMA